jgi:hypothetical protein
MRCPNITYSSLQHNSVPSGFTSTRTNDLSDLYLNEATFKMVRAGKRFTDVASHCYMPLFSHVQDSTKYLTPGNNPHPNAIELQHVATQGGKS